MKYLCFFIILSLSLSCTKDFHLRKSQKHYKKALQLGHSPQVDTIYVPDTIYRDNVRVDTLIHVEQAQDTFIIERDRVITKLLYKNDSIFIESECIADTIIREIPLTITEKVYIEKNAWQSLGWPWKILIIIVCLLVIWRIITKFI